MLYQKARAFELYYLTGQPKYLLSDLYERSGISRYVAQSPSGVTSSTLETLAIYTAIPGARVRCIDALTGSVTLISQSNNGGATTSVIQDRQRTNTHSAGQGQLNISPNHIRDSLTHIRSYTGPPLSDSSVILIYLELIKRHQIIHDDLIDFVDSSLLSKGYSYAVSFVAPLLALPQINHHYFLYFLSQILLNCSDTSSILSDYTAMVLRKIPEMSNPASKIFEQFTVVCLTKKMERVHLMV